MIPQADLERAIDRWKARKEGRAAPDDGGFSIEAEATVVGESSEILPADSGMIAVSDEELEQM